MYSMQGPYQNPPEEWVSVHEGVDLSLSLPEHLPARLLPLLQHGCLHPALQVDLNVEEVIKYTKHIKVPCSLQWMLQRCPLLAV